MLVVGCWLSVVGWNPTVKAVGTVAGLLGLLVFGCWFWVRMLIEDLAVYLSKIPKTNNRKPTTTRFYFFLVFTLNCDTLLMVLLPCTTEAENTT